jgi:hypothetical protein
MGKLSFLQDTNLKAQIVMAREDFHESRFADAMYCFLMANTSKKLILVHRQLLVKPAYAWEGILKHEKGSKHIS